MSSRSSSSANKKLDEKNLKILRELAALIYNKQCFDCHQRGPTYVNMTIGSFVCTSCSGRLRGLNPPHRVKSISMATFTHDEIEFIKSRGNEYCRKVWMGRHDKSRTMDETSFKDETQMKDFLTLKYEKKRWYVSPSDIPPQELPPQLTGGSTGSTGSGAGQQQMTLQNNHLGSNNFTSNSSKAPANHPQPTASVQSPTSPPPKQNLVNLIDDPFGSPAPTPSAVASNGSGFANFANFDAFAPSPAHQLPSSHHLQQPLQQTSQVRPIDQTSAMPKSATIPAMSGAKPNAVQGTSPGDKYSALKELDELFSQPTPTPQTNAGQHQQATAAPSWMPPPGSSNSMSAAGYSGHNVGASSKNSMTSSFSAFNVGLNALGHYHQQASGSAGMSTAHQQQLHHMMPSSVAFSAGNPFFPPSQSINTSVQQPMPPGAWGTPANQQQHQQHQQAQQQANNAFLAQQTNANPFFGGQPAPQQQASMMPNPFGGGGPMTSAGVPSPYGAMPPTGGYAGAMSNQQQQQHMYAASQQAQQQWATNAVSNPFAVGQQQQGGWNPFFK